MKIVVDAFSTPRGFKLNMSEESSIAKSDERLDLMEFACSHSSKTNCQFKLYFGKRKQTHNFILECAQFIDHNHELVISKKESAEALNRLDFCPPDNKFHVPQTLKQFT